jgi:hypothetical protein
MEWKSAAIFLSLARDVRRSTLWLLRVSFF